MKLTLITASAALFAFPVLAERHPFFPQCEMVDMGGYFNLAPAGCAKEAASAENERGFDLTGALAELGVTIKDLGPERQED